MTEEEEKDIVDSLRKLFGTVGQLEARIKALECPVSEEEPDHDYPDNPATGQVSIAHLAKLFSQPTTDAQDAPSTAIDKAITTAMKAYHDQAEENIRYLMRSGVNILRLDEERDWDGNSKLYAVGFMVETLEERRILVSALGPLQVKRDKEH